MNTAALAAMRQYANGRPWTIDAEGYKIEGVLTPDSAWMPMMLTGYAAQKRQARMNAGMTVTIGDRQIPIWTDADSRAALLGAVVAVQANPQFATGWKGSDGQFYQMSASDIVAMSQAVLGYVNDAFAREATAVAQIASGVISTTEQIDNAFA